MPAFEKEQAVSCAYLKFINVPSILDIGGTTPDPTDESLTMSMIDYETLKEISPSEISTLGQCTNIHPFNA